MNGNPLIGWSPDPADITLTGTGLRRPECVLAQPSGDLWVADLSGGVLHIAPDGSQEVIRPRDSAGPFAPDENPNIDGNQGFSMPNGLCFDAEGNFVIANFGTDVVEHLSRDGHWSPVTDTVLWPDGSTRPIGKANFPALDAEGRLWFSVTASAEAWRHREQQLAADGYIAVIDDFVPGTPAVGRVVATDLAGTNEMRFSPDGQELYVAETGGDHMTRFRVGPSGTLADREVYGPDRLYGAPDGFAFDAHGNLWTTLIGRDKLVAITPEGDVLTIWEDGDRAVEEAARRAPQDSGARHHSRGEARRRPGPAHGQHHLRGTGPAHRLRRLARWDLAAHLPFPRPRCASAALGGVLLTSTLAKINEACQHRCGTGHPPMGGADGRADPNVWCLGSFSLR